MLGEIPTEASGAKVQNRCHLDEERGEICYKFQFWVTNMAQ